MHFKLLLWTQTYIHILRVGYRRCTFMSLMYFACAFAAALTAHAYVVHHLQISLRKSAVKKREFVRFVWFELELKPPLLGFKSSQMQRHSSKARVLSRDVRKGEGLVNLFTLRQATVSISKSLHITCDHRAAARLLTSLPVFVEGEDPQFKHSSVYLTTCLSVCLFVHLVQLRTRTLCA